MAQGGAAAEALFAETIFALSSGAPPAAIAIVRVSGPAAAGTVAALAGPLPPARLASLRAVRARDGELVDRGLVLWFPAAGSVTGGDLAEFHVHGGRAVVARLLAVLAAEPGLRLAKPGEFTRRSLLNGRIDLVAAEGLADLLLADTEAERRGALKVHDGVLGTLIEGWRVRLLDLSAQAEALIDYSDEGDVAGAQTEAALRAGLAALAVEVSRVAAGRDSEALRDGLSVVLAGPPNSGKSSLLNAIAGHEAALVTPIAGTTRDVIEVPVRIGDRRYRLSDTAGLRDTDDVVERLGVERARRAAATADMVVWLGDGPPEDFPAPVLAIWPRCDIVGRAGAGSRLAVSARTGEGIEALFDWIGEQGADAGQGDRMVLNGRQRGAAAELATELCDAASALDVLIVGDHLRMARGAIDRFGGGAGLDEILDHLFARFCVGK